MAQIQKSAREGAKQASAEMSTPDFVQDFVGKFSNTESFVVIDSAELTRRLDDLERRLNDPALMAEMRPSLLDLSTALGASIPALRDPNNGIPQGVQDRATALYDRMRRELFPEIAAGEGSISGGGTESTGAPVVERIEELPPTTYVRPEQRMIEAEIRIPTHLVRYFVEEYRRVADLWSYGFALEYAERSGNVDQALRDAMEGMGMPTSARDCGQELAGILMRRMGFDNMDSFLNGEWNATQTQDVLSMLGLPSGTVTLPDGRTMDSTELARMVLTALSEGRFTDAFNIAPEGSTLDQVVTDLVEDTINNRVNILVPQFGAELSVEAQRIPIADGVWWAPRAFGQMVVDRNFRPVATFENGRLTIAIEPTGEHTVMGGGGGGVALGYEGYISLYVEGRFDAYMQRPIFMGQLTVANETGQWGTPMLDGVFFPKVYGSLDSEGHMIVGATVLTCLVHRGANSFYLETAFDYSRDVIVTGSESDREAMRLAGGAVWNYDQTLNLRGGAMYDPLQNQFAGVYFSTEFPVAEATDLSLGYTLVPLYLGGQTYWTHLFTFGVRTDFGIGYGQQGE